MLSNIVQLSLRSIHTAKLLKRVNLKSTIRCRYATNWSSRKPVSIVNENELFDTDDTQTTVASKEVHRRISRIRRRKPKKQEKKENEEAKEQIYTALKEDDKIISSLMIDIKTKKKREKSNQMLLEGFRLIEDAIKAGAIPKVIFFSKLSDVLSLSLPKEVKLYKIPYRTIQLWSNLTTSPGIIGIFNIPDVKTKQLTNDAIPLTIICDNIREPGNLGTIIRIAAAVGCEKLLLMKGCVDLWEPKVLRSAVGAHFHVPIFTSLSWNEIPTLISDESAIFLADNNTTYENKSDNYEINLGSDITTPIEVNNTDMEKNSSDVSIENSENNETSQLLTKSNKPTAKTKLLVKKIISQFPIVPYHTVDFTKKEMVLIIGGETEGVSLQSCELLCARNCSRVNISLTNGIDSLNSASAVSIITFEMKRQFISRKIDDE